MTEIDYATITITNAIPSGAAFGVKHGTGESCYLPATVMFMSGAKPGDVAEVILIENPNDEVRARTPYMVRYVKPAMFNPVFSGLPLVAQAFPPSVVAQTPAPEPAPMLEDVTKYVRATMLKGGVWTVSSLYRGFLKNEDATRTDNLQVYNWVSYAVRTMFDNDECAKWSMWTKKSQSKPGRDWFSCYPQSVDVAEWEE